jgi:hypothetical protein
VLASHLCSGLLAFTLFSGVSVAQQPDHVNPLAPTELHNPSLRSGVDHHAGSRQMSFLPRLTIISVSTTYATSGMWSSAR